MKARTQKKQWTRERREFRKIMRRTRDWHGLLTAIERTKRRADEIVVASRIEPDCIVCNDGRALDPYDYPACAACGRRAQSTSSPTRRLSGER